MRGKPSFVDTRAYRQGSRTTDGKAACQQPRKTKGSGAFAAIWAELSKHGAQFSGLPMGLLDVDSMSRLP
jgi:hypothetical protein